MADSPGGGKRAGAREDQEEEQCGQSSEVYEGNISDVAQEHGEPRTIESALEAATQESVSVRHQHAGTVGIAGTSSQTTPRQLSAGANESDIHTAVVMSYHALTNRRAVLVGSSTEFETASSVFVGSEFVEEGCDEETEAMIDDHDRRELVGQSAPKSNQSIRRRHARQLK